jgi:GWxTD domain-containing protein
MRKISVGLAIVMMSIAVAVVAQLPAPYDTWGQGPVKHLMTKEEAKKWSGVRTEAEAKAFVELFWAKRDPTPATPRNEFHEEFDLRAAAADEYFTTIKTKGSMTDRGMALILLGQPYTMGAKGAAAGASGTNQTLGVSDLNITVGGARGSSAMLTWAYSNDKKPKFIKRKDFEILFSDDSGRGEYQFAITPRTNPNTLFQEAVNAYLLWPDLTKPPTSGTEASASPAKSTTFRDAALKAAYDKFKAEQKPVGTAHLTWGEYVTPEGDGFVPVSLFMPASANVPSGRKVTFFGAVENAAGEVVQILEEEATLIASGRDAYVDKSLTLAPGTYKAAFGVAADGQPLALTSAELTVQGLKAGDTAVSQLILSNHAVPLAQAQKRTDPFTFGGLKVVPKGDAVFVTSDELWYFLEMRNPGLGDTGAPKVMVKLDINGKTVAGKSEKLDFPMQEVEALPLKGVPNHYGLVQAFPLADFEPGLYTVKLKVIDSVLKKTYQMEKQFEVRKL